MLFQIQPYDFMLQSWDKTSVEEFIRVLNCQLYLEINVVLRGRIIDQRLIVYHKQHLTFNMKFKMATLHVQSDRMEVMMISTALLALVCVSHK